VTDEFWLRSTLALLAKCDALVTTPRWLESSGARNEVARATRLGLATFIGGADRRPLLRLAEWVSACDSRSEAIANRLKYTARGSARYALAEWRDTHDA